MADQYKNTHFKIKSQHGPAKYYACALCGSYAEHWAYMHTDPAEVFDGTRTWSLHPDHYQPMCARDHRAFDKAHRTGKAYLLAEVIESAANRYSQEQRDGVPETLARSRAAYEAPWRPVPRVEARAVDPQ